MANIAKLAADALAINRALALLDEGERAQFRTQYDLAAATPAAVPVASGIDAAAPPEALAVMEAPTPCVMCPGTAYTVIHSELGDMRRCVRCGHVQALPGEPVTAIQAEGQDSAAGAGLDAAKSLGDGQYQMADKAGGNA